MVYVDDFHLCIICDRKISFKNTIANKIKMVQIS